MAWCKILLYLLLVYPGLISGQSKNYLRLRDAIFIGGCGLTDRPTLEANLHALENLDTTAITRNMHKFYEDLAMTYWKLGKPDDVVMQDKFISYSYKALFHKPGSRTALYNLSMGYFLRNDCVKANEFLAQYKLALKDQEDPEHERMIRERCPD